MALARGASSSRREDSRRESARRSPAASGGLRGLVAEVDVDGRPPRVFGVPIKLSETPGRVERRPPRFGEHTDEVLAELGLSAPEIAELRAKGVAS